MTRDSKLICSVVFRNVDFLQFVLDESSSLGLRKIGSCSWTSSLIVENFPAIKIGWSAM